jgi:hypothetical protein
MLHINPIFDGLKQRNIRLDDQEVAARIQHLVAPPACTACPFYGKMGGVHYCGMKTCFKRKKKAWNRHMIQNASQKLGMAVYDEKVDGPKRVLQHGEYQLAKTKKADCRLLPRDQYGRTAYQYIEGVPSCAFVVLVGKSMETIKEKEHEERVEIRSKNADARKAKQLEEQVKALLWEIAPCFHGIFDGMPLEAVDALWNLADEAFHWEVFDLTQDQQQHHELDYLTINIVCRYIEWNDEMPPAEVADEIEKVAKLWKVKLPKDWAGRMIALGEEE